MLDNIYFENNIPRNFALLFLLLSAFVSIMLALIQHRKKQIDDNSAKPATPQWLVAILVLLFFGGAWVVLVHQKSHHDYDDVRDSYHKHATTDTAVVKNQVSKLFGSIYHDLRTIAALTSVRNIDSKLPMIDSNAHETIQQLYNSLHDEAKISEIYIVQADINPDAIDPRTKKPQEPHFMFDSMIGGRTSRELTGEDIVISDNDAEEVEIHEYRALREQMAWIKEHYPTRASFKGKNVPMLSSKPVITCDNSHYNRTRDNKDRTGIIFSVPIYSLEGKFQGTVSAILLQNELQAALPDQHYTLINQTQDYIIASKSDGQQTLSAQAVAEQKPDSNLIYSEITSIDTPDVQNQWALWVGLPNSRFVNSDAISSVR
ncbi:MAG: hypothetical protein EBR02_05520, partial [Alphaproteobacteria bacterium]|nr:hypothetical protein [Alphaproteobacteria bacterium]